MIIYKSRWLTRGEVWFDHEPACAPVDWIIYHHRTSPQPKSKWKYSYTLLMDISVSPDELLSQMDKNTISQIKQARDKDKIICDRCDATEPEALNRFADFYDRFAVHRQLEKLDRKWLVRTAEAGVLDLDLAKSPESHPLVYHVIVRGQNRARHLYSASFFRAAQDSFARNLVGRANRLLYWNSMLRLRERGTTVFDFGGWYVGHANEEKLRINEFKKRFGGQVVRNYSCEQILTLKGWIVVSVAKMLCRT